MCLRETHLNLYLYSNLTRLCKLLGFRVFKLKTIFSQFSQQKKFTGQVSSLSANCFLLIKAIKQHRNTFGVVTWRTSTLMVFAPKCSSVPPNSGKELIQRCAPYGEYIKVTWMLKNLYPKIMPILLKA